MGFLDGVGDFIDSIIHPHPKKKSKGGFPSIREATSKKGIRRSRQRARALERRTGIGFAHDSHPKREREKKTYITNPRSKHGEVVGGYPGFLMQGGQPDPRVEGKSSRPKGMTTAQYLAQLAAQLEQGKIDYEQALRQSANEIRQAYKIDIKAIRGNNRSARKQTARDRREVEGMYNQLAHSYLNSAKRENKQGRRDAKGMQRLADHSSQTLKNQTASLIKNEDQLAKDLGAPGSSSGDLTKEVVKDMGAIQKHGTNAATTSKQFSQNQRNFMRRGAKGAKFEGVDQSTALLRELEGYTRGNRDKIAGLKSQRHRELAANRSNTMAQVDKINMQNAQDTWERAMDIANFRQDNAQFRQTQRANAAKLRASIAGQRDSKAGQDNPLYPMMKFAAKSKHPKQVAGFLQSLMKNPQYASGQTKDPAGNLQKMTPEQRANFAEAQARKQGLRGKDIAMVRLAAMRGVDS